MRRAAFVGLLVVSACEAQRGRQYVSLDGLVLGGDTFDGVAQEDPNAPHLELADPPPRVRGGDTWSGLFSIAAESPIELVQLQYARDGYARSDHVNVDASSTEVSWTFERVDVPAARLRLIALDTEGRVGEDVSSAFAIDSTGPAVPEFSFDVPSITHERDVPLRIASCGDASDLALLESSDVVSGDEGGGFWQPCTISAARAPAPTIHIEGDGLHTIFVWARDDVHNPSPAPESALVTLDTTPPVVTLSAPLMGGYLGPGDIIAWSATDLHLFEGSATVELSADGVSYTPVADGLPTNGSLDPALLSAPELSAGVYQVRVSVIDLAGNVGTSSTHAFDYNTAPPTITVTAPTAGQRAQGGTGATVSFSWTVTEATVADGGAFIIEQYDGVSWSAVGPPVLASTSGPWVEQAFSTEWLAPALDTTEARLRVSYTNGWGISATAVSEPFTVDSTPPVVALSAPLDGGYIGPSDVVAWTAMDPHLLAASATVELSSNGVSYTTVASGLPTTGSFDLAQLSTPALTAGVYHVRVSVADAVGNIGTSSVHSFDYNTAPPTIIVTAPVAGQQVQGGQGAVVSFAWTVTEASVADAGEFIIEQYDGIAWSSVGPPVSAPPTGPWLQQAFSFDWSTLAIDTTEARLRVSYTNAWGVTGSAESAAFTVDATPPIVTSVTVNGGVSSSSNNVLPFSIDADDDQGPVNTGISAYMLASNPEFLGGVWVTSLPATFPFPHVTGAYRLYVQVRDGVGNISAPLFSSEITVFIGEAPVINFIQPDGSSTYDETSTIHVSWTISSAHPLVPDSLDVLYTTDGGETVMPWPGGTGTGQSVYFNGGCTQDPGATGCIDLQLSAEVIAAGTFKLLLRADDDIGNTSQVMSAPLNGPQLALFAGRDAFPYGGTANSTSLLLSTIGRDPITGDIYVGSPCRIGIIHANNGVIEHWAGNPKQCTNSGDGELLANITFFGTPSAIRVDHNRNVYWTAHQRVWRYDRMSGTASIYLGCVNMPCSREDGTDRRSFNGNVSRGFHRLALGAGDRVYFELMNLCADGSPSGQNCSAVYRVEDDGSVTHLAGTISGALGPKPTEGSDAKQAGLLSFALEPGAVTSADRIFVMGFGGYPAAQGGLWELMDGQLYGIKPTLGAILVGALPSRGLLVFGTVHGGLMTLWDPDDPDTVYPSRPVSTVDSTYSVQAVQDDGFTGYYLMGDKGHYVYYVTATDQLVVYAGTDPAAGDGGPAVSAEVRAPSQVTFDPDGNTYLWDTGNNKIRMVDAGGIISTSSGPGTLSSGLRTGGPYKKSSAIFSGITTLGGTCVWYCGGVEDASHPFAPTTTSAASATDLAVYRSVSPDSDYVEQVHVAFDGDITYLHESEYWTENGGTPEVIGRYRTYIKKIDAAGAYTMIAGDVSAVTSSYEIPGGTLLAGNHAGYPMRGVTSTGFRAVNGKLYFLASAAGGDQIFAGVEGGSWVQQGTRNTRGFAVDASDRMYFIDVANRQLYRRNYAADGNGSETQLGDFSTTFSNPIVQAVKPAGPNQLIFLSNGNAVYTYSAPP